VHVDEGDCEVQGQEVGAEVSCGVVGEGGIGLDNDPDEHIDEACAKIGAGGDPEHVLVLVAAEVADAFAEGGPDSFDFNKEVASFVRC
jgi:hypothetical protein